MAESRPGRVALVTGAAGGIGRAVVGLLLTRGYAVIAEDISPGVAELGADALVVPLQADVALSESARRAAIVQLTRQLAVEHAHRGVRVNAVAPGAVDTDFVAHAREAAADPDPAGSRAASVSQHPLGRILTPAEIAEAIVFLASPAASGITGAILSVDGGYVAR